MKYPIAATVGEITPSRVGAIVRAATDTARTPGRRPTDAVTPGSQRGRAALTTLTADATAAGLTVEVYLARARSWLIDKVRARLADADPGEE